MSVPPAAWRTGTSLQLPWAMGNRAANPACGGREVQPAPRRQEVPAGKENTLLRRGKSTPSCGLAELLPATVKAPAGIFYTA